MIEVLPQWVEVAGRKKISITLRDGERVLDADIVDPYQAKQRRRAAKRLAARAGDPFTPQQIEESLLRCLDEMERASQAQDAAVEVPLPRMNVVRPELVITPQAVGISVSETIIRDGQALGRWRIFLRLGKTGEAEQRQSRALAGEIDAGGHHLWVHPVPGDPAPSCPGGWSEESRMAWLKGAQRDPVALFDELCATLGEFLDVEEGVASGEKAVGGQLPVASEEAIPKLATHSLATPPLIATLALWIMLSYAYVAFDAVPYLFVNGPAGSGKTRVFELLCRLVFRPLASSNLSAPALFRTLHERGGTVLLDEAERLGEGGDDVGELRSILLAGYKRGGRASRLESIGDRYQMNEFAVYGPKAVACINPLPTALASRCILVSMFRSPPDSDKPRRRIDADPARWQRLRDDLHIVALGPLADAALELSGCADLCPLNGRQYELWQPILALAGWIDHQRLIRDRQAAKSADAAIPRLHLQLLEYARRLSERAADSVLPEEDFLLLWVLTEKSVRDEQPTCRMLLYSARLMDAEAMRGFSERRVAEILKGYGLSTVRSNGRSIFRDVLKQLKRIKERYGVDLNTAGIQTVRCVPLKGR
jgi:hypothetical protein